jgi:putative spermidine/putrescine transport system ATP-binding protein
MPHSLSGGQQQRVSLARAFSQQPKLMLLDEPFSALDPISRAEMRELFRGIRKEHKIPTIFVTHDREEAFELSDRIAVIADGRIEQLGKPHELYDRPNSLYIARLLGIANIFQFKNSSGWFELPVPWQQSIPPIQGDGLLLRPEWITLKPWQDSSMLEQVEPKVKGRIIDLKHRPGLMHGTVKLSESPLEIEITYNPSQSFHVGDEVAIHVDPRGWRFISTE